MNHVYEVTCPVCKDREQTSRVYITQKELRADGSAELEYACDEGHTFREKWDPESPQSNGK